MPTPDPQCPYPHYGDGPWECCQIFAENFPSNLHAQAGAPEDEVLPGWTAQSGNHAPYVEPRIVCAFCDGEYTFDELHLHTRAVHGYELAIDEYNRDPHPYSATGGHVDELRTEERGEGPVTG